MRAAAAATSDTMDVRKSQRLAVERMLALSSDEDASAEAGPVDWKVLILDEPCRLILAPLISVNELRKRGVTLHAPLESDRDALDDVAAVYLCRPTEANASRVARDCAAGLYGACYVNWSTRVDRRVLEGLARELAAAPTAAPAEDRVAAVWDRHVDFVALEPRLFALGAKRAFAEWHGPGGDVDARRDALATKLAAGLFCVCATAGAAAPVLRCAEGGAAEAVARKLHALLADEWRRRGAAGGGDGARKRPLLVLLDRHCDLATPLRHTETYQALVDDVLDHEANVASFADESGSKKVDLRVDEDGFYGEHASKSFPDVIDASGEALATLRAAENALRARGAGQDATEADGDAAKLAETVGELPALLARKKLLEHHTAVLGAVMKAVVAREVPRYCEAEDARAAADQLAELLGPAGKGSANDKLRLYAYHALEADADDARVAELRAALGDDPALARGLAGIDYARGLGGAHAAGPAREAPPAADDDAFKALLQKAHAGTKHLVTKAAKNVGNLFKSSETYAAKVLSNLFEARPNTEHDSWLELDAKLAPSYYASGKAGGPGAAADAPLDAIVFVVGPGCYAEHHALQRTFADGPRTVVYGAADLLNADALLDELADLAAASA